ncbi:hypothetical protein [Pseudactinotalea sp. Z1748]|uniref:hypothetical protein n=1 Tax=Pseudactinotalea sp. Z1748 TaxID=3413027 RepID=UPI003C7CC2FA
MSATDTAATWVDEAHYTYYFSVLDHALAGQYDQAHVQLVHLVADAIKLAPQVSTQEVVEQVRDYRMPQVRALIQHHDDGQVPPPVRTTDWAKGVRGIAELLHAASQQ